MALWDYRSRGWAERAWERWLSWALRSNAMAESVNSKIKALKMKARGYRNRERYKTAILFHYGGLNLHP